MPVVQQLTLLHDIGRVPKGTKIKIVTPSIEEQTTAGIFRALRKAGFTDDQFNNKLTYASNWKYKPLPNEDPGELNLQLARFSEPIYGEQYERKPMLHQNQDSIKNTNIGNNQHQHEPLFSGPFWGFWKELLGGFFWIALIFLLPLSFVFYLIKWIFKFILFLFLNILNLITFGLFDLGRDLDDFFDD